MKAVEKLDTQIASVQGEIASTALMPLTIAERFSAIEGELRNAEHIYRSQGLNPTAGHPGETVHLQRLALAGACMVVGGPKLLAVERERVAAAGEGLSAVDKAKKLEQLRGQILRLAARRELTLRENEGDSFADRPFHPEMVVWQRADLERMAR